MARVLAAIGTGPEGEAGTWATIDGRFRVGALTGRWVKTTAAYIGEGAREAARRARIETIHSELVFLQGELSMLAELVGAVAARREVLDAEVADVPDETALTRAHARVAAAAESLRRTGERQEERAAAPSGGDRPERGGGGGTRPDRRGLEDAVRRGRADGGT
ncbi:hypothetical protein SMICM304S_07293 [Streptomyces microflavus]